MNSNKQNTAVDALHLDFPIAFVPFPNYNECPCGIERATLQSDVGNASLDPVLMGQVNRQSRILLGGGFGGGRGGGWLGGSRGGGGLDGGGSGGAGVSRKPMFWFNAAYGP